MRPSVTRYTSRLFGHRRLVLAATMLVMVFSVLGIMQITIDTEFTVFMPSHSQSLDAVEAMAAEFGDTGQLVVLAPVGFDQDRLEHLRVVATKIRAIDGVAGVDASLPEAGGPGSSVSAARASSLIESEGERYAMIRIRLAERAHPRPVIREIRDRFSAAAFDIVLTGEPFLEAEVFSYILRIILTIPPIAIVLMLTVFRLRIGSFRATILSMVPAIAGAVVTLGAIGWIVGSVSIVTVLVPIFVIVLGSADGLHVTSHVIDELRAGNSNESAVQRTLEAVGSPIVMTTVTTMAGFLSMLLIQSAAMRELGVVAAGGILVAGAATWVILPTILLGQKPLRVRKSRNHGVLTGALRTLQGAPALLLGAALVGAFVPGLLRLRASFSMIDVYKPNTDVRLQIEQSSALLGGSIPVYVTTETSDPFSQEVAEAYFALEELAGVEGLVGRSITAHRVIAEIYGEMPGVSGYPPTSVFARRVFESAGAIAGIETGTLVSEQRVRGVFFLRDLDDSTLTRFLEITEQVSRDTGVELAPIGTAFVMKEMNDQITSQQFASLGLAVFLVFVLTAATQRSVLLGLAATAPILITLVVLFGVMGYASIDLSVITGIMSGLTIGVGIDYAIHFVSMFRQAHRAKADDPVSKSLDYVTTPVLANALGLAIGFTAMLASPLQIHVTLSILMWVTMMASSLLSLTFLPTLVSRLKPGR